VRSLLACMRQFALWCLLHALLVRVAFAAMRPAESGWPAFSRCGTLLRARLFAAAMRCF
jgi:hypothetical protein